MERPSPSAGAPLLRPRPGPLLRPPRSPASAPFGTPLPLRDRFAEGRAGDERGTSSGRAGGEREVGDGSSGVPGRPGCSNTCRRRAVLHRSGENFPSTAWGSKSCPYCIHRRGSRYSIRPAQGAGDLWSTMIHSLWTSFSSTGGDRRCPPSAHRQAVVFPRLGGLLHTAVHCSATRHPLSPHRVKGVTPRGSVGLWETWPKLGTVLGRNPPALCIGCAQLSGVHRNTKLSTGATHRVGGQKTGPDLGKQRYPPFPQALLLLPPIVSPESASKWGLCTTRRRSSPNLSSRLDPEQHRVSVPYVRLVPASSPRHRWSDPTRRRRPAGRASNSRRRFR